MAFDLFLALVPMLGLGGWAAAVLVGPESNRALRALFLDVTPAQLANFVGRHFEALSAAHLAPLAALAGWWLSSSAFDTMIGVFEETFDCVPRNWLHSRLISLGFALLGMVLLGVGSGLYVWLTVVVGGWENWTSALRKVGVLPWILLIVGMGVIASFLALIYRYSLRRPHRRRHVWVGAFTATGIGVLATAALGYYASNIARYALFYGGLAAIVVVLLWLWLWSTAILIGAEINIAVEDVKTASKDRTVGRAIDVSANRSRVTAHSDT
jgi:membrane protein